MSKIANPMKVITGPDTRWSYANVWEPKSINGGAPKFSVSPIIPKTDTATIEKIQNAINTVGKEKGYTYILDLATGAAVFVGTDAVDANKDVKAKLGIK